MERWTAALVLSNARHSHFLGVLEIYESSLKFKLDAKSIPFAFYSLANHAQLGLWEIGIEYLCSHHDEVLAIETLKLVGADGEARDACVKIWKMLSTSTATLRFP